MGTVIDEPAARLFEARVDEAIARVRACWPATSVTARCTPPR
jgi:hypothetical protein